MKKWKCSVCGYIHKGDEPPEKCPVCGADKSRFVELKDEAASPEDDRASEKVTAPEALTGQNEPDDEKASRAKTGLYGALGEWMAKLHAHPIAVHIPNGLLPVSVVFLGLSWIFGWTVLDRAAFYNLIVVALSMPLVLFTGYVDWHRGFGGHLTTYFKIKIGCGVTVSIVSVVIVIWMLMDPQVVRARSAAFIFFMLLNAVMLAAAVTAGFIGGRLVFGSKPLTR